MRLSVVIPTYRGLRHLETCLPSVAAATAAAGFPCETIVVDDASGDGTVDFLRSRWPAVRVIEQPANGGFVKAANAGLRAAAGEWIALVNNDVVLDAGWARAALGGDVAADAGAIATRILQMGQEDTLYSAGDEYATAGMAIPWLRGQPATADERRPVCFSACAAAGLYRREALEKCGLFRENLGAYYEDVDLGFRLNLAGYRCIYVPGAVSRHAGGGTYGKNSWRMIYNSTRNRELVFWSNMPASLLARYGAAHVAGNIVQLFMGILTAEALPRAAGMAAAVLRAGDLLRMRRESRALRVISPAELRRRLCTKWLRPILRSKIEWQT
jgi:GT2 family glycosyltransferase